MYYYNGEYREHGDDERASRSSNRWITFFITLICVAIALVFVGMNAHYSSKVVAAIKADDYQKLERLVDNKKLFTLNMPTEIIEGYFEISETPLQAACTEGNYDMAKYLLDNGADVNFTFFDDDSPLNCAIESDKKGRLKLVHLLVEYGADCNKPDSFGEAPLLNAAWTSCWYEDKGTKQWYRHDEEKAKESTEIYQYILKHVKDKNPKSVYSGDTALSMAAENGNESLTKFLIYEQRLDINAQNDWGETALFLIAEYDNEEEQLIKIAKLLIDSGIDVSIKDNEGNTAYEYAVKNGNTKLASVIKTYGKQ